MSPNVGDPAARLVDDHIICQIEEQCVHRDVARVARLRRVEVDREALEVAGGTLVSNEHI